MTRIPTHNPLPHPGEILEEEFLKPLGVTQTRLAEQTGVSFQRVHQLVNGKRGVSEVSDPTRKTDPYLNLIRRSSCEKTPQPDEPTVP